MTDRDAQDRLDQEETFRRGRSRRSAKSVGDVDTIGRDAGPAVNPPQPRSGARVPKRYRVKSEIGHGGMGIVYRCFDEVSGMDVALKMLPPEVAHDTAEMDSVRENYGLVEGLHHPNIAALKQLDPVPDTQDFALVMEVHLRAARASPADRGQDRRRPVVLRAAGVAGLESPQGGDEHAYFWATHGGAEMDLCVMRGATRIGMEFTHTSAPALTRSMAIARTDLRLRRVYVVHPGDRTFALDDRTVAVGLNVLAARLKEDGVGKG